MQGTDHSQLIAAGEYAMHQLFIVLVGIFLGGQGAGHSSCTRWWPTSAYSDCAGLGAEIEDFAAG